MSEERELAPAPGERLAATIAGTGYGLVGLIAGGLGGVRALGRRALGVAGEVAAPAVEGVARKLAESPELDALIRTKVTALLPQLVADPAVVALVREQIERVLTGLVGHALVTELVRNQVEAVIEHLHGHPDSLEALVSGQGQRFLDERRTILRRKAATAAGIDPDLVDEIRKRRESGESVAAIATRRLRRVLGSVLGRARR